MLSDEDKGPPQIQVLLPFLCPGTGIQRSLGQGALRTHITPSTLMAVTCRAHQHHSQYHGEQGVHPQQPGTIFTNNSSRLSAPSHGQAIAQNVDQIHMGSREPSSLYSSRSITRLTYATARGRGMNLSQLQHSHIPHWCTLVDAVLNPQRDLDQQNLIGPHVTIRAHLSKLSSCVEALQLDCIACFDQASMHLSSSLSPIHINIKEQHQQASPGTWRPLRRIIGRNSMQSRWPGV